MRTGALDSHHSTINSQPKVKGRKRHCASGPCHFNKEQTPLAVYSTPTRGFTAAVSVFRGTPPPKPLICKSVSIRLGARNRPAWTHHVGGTPLHSCASIRLALSDIIKTSLCYRSQIVTFRCCHLTVSFREQKNPAYFAVSRVRERNSSFDLQNLPTPSLSKLPSGRCPMGARDSLWLNAQPGLYRL